MRIRKATEQDLEAVERIYEGARRFMRQSGNQKQWQNGYPSREDALRDMEKGGLYVCEEDPAAGQEPGEPLAVFSFFLEEEPNYRVIQDGAWTYPGPYGVIHRIAVSEKARGKGAARFCMAYGEQHAQVMRIDTHEDNLPMQGLIKSCGYRYAGIIFVEDGTPRYAYEKQCGGKAEESCGKGAEGSCCGKAEKEEGR